MATKKKQQTKPARKAAPKKGAGAVKKRKNLAGVGSKVSAGVRRTAPARASQARGRSLTESLFCRIGKDVKPRILKLVAAGKAVSQAEWIRGCLEREMVRQEKQLAKRK